jgi:hypothetical protein
VRNTGGIRRVRVELGGSIAATRWPLSADLAGAAHFGDRLLSEPSTGVQLEQREPPFVP